MGVNLVTSAVTFIPGNVLTYRTVRTFPGMKVTADVTRFTPMVR